MESFPSRAIRAFDKPVTFTYAPETGSFCINGTVADQPVTLTAGPAATAEDPTASITLSSVNMTVAEMSDIVTNKMRLQTYLRGTPKHHVETKAFSEQRLNFSGPFYYEETLPALLSDTNLGDFIIDTVGAVQPFASKELGRENLKRVNLNLSHEASDMVATDGHRLQVASIPVSYILRDEPPIKLALPSKLLTALKLESCLVFEYRDTGPAGTLTCFSKEYDIISIQWGKSDSAYPAWQAVVPDVSLDEFDNNERGYYATDHCFELLHKIPASCRKEGMSIHLLADDGRAHPEEEPLCTIPAFGVMTDNTGGYSVIHLAGDIEEQDIPHVQDYIVFKAKYGWELGKCLKKLPTEDIMVYLAKENDPIRVDWKRGDVEYTHVLMPFRRGNANKWPSADEG